MPSSPHTGDFAAAGLDIGDDQSIVIPAATVVELGGHRVDVGSFLRKDYDDIATAAVELPALIEWCNCQLQVLTEQKIRLEDEVKRCEAKAWFRFMHDGGWPHPGRKTTYAVAMAVRLDEAVVDSQEKLAVFTGWHQRVLNAMRSLQAKLDLVRSSEATRRRIFAGHSDSNER